MAKQKYRKGVFIVAYAIEKNKPVYILQKRKLHWSGWEFPKGGVETFERKKSTVKRELLEETNLSAFNIKNHKVKGKYKYEKPLKDRPGIIGQTYTLFSAQVKKGKIKIDKTEHTSSKWVNYKDAMKLITHKNQKECLKIINKYLLSKVN